MTLPELTKADDRSALLIGLIFIGLQTLAHTKVITINWDMIEKQLIGKIDQDGDGQLTMKCVVIVLAHTLWSYLEIAVILGS